MFDGTRLAQLEERVRKLEGFVVIQDEQGGMRAMLGPGINRGDSVGLSLCDGKGKTRASLKLDKDGHPSLSLSDATGRPRLVLELNKDGSPILSLADENGKMRIDVLCFSDGTPRIRLADPSGQTRMQIDRIAISSYDSNGVVRSAMGNRSDGASYFVVMDSKGNERTGFLVDAEDVPAVRLRCAAGDTSIAITPSMNGQSSIQFLGETTLQDGKAGLMVPRATLTAAGVTLPNHETILWNSLT